MKKYAKLVGRGLLLVGIGLLWIGKSTDEHFRTIMNGIAIVLMVLYLLQVIFTKNNPAELKEDDSSQPKQ